MFSASEFEEAPAQSTWGQGSANRFLALAGSRAVAQVLGLAWFVVAARILSDEGFGVVATGMAFFAVFAGIGDLGTNRTIVRHVAADPSVMRSAFVHSIRLRSCAGVLVGVASASVVALIPVPVSWLVVLLAGLMATASGITELGFSALRAVGRIRAEVVLLVIERLLFLVVGITVVACGGGPVAVLVVYLATNAVSAAVVSAIVVASGGRAEIAATSFTDREARFTAGGFALLVVSPRLAPLLLALLASAAAVGEFTVAQRPVEALTLFALSTLAPLLPIVRGRIVADQRDAANSAARAVAGSVLIVLAPVVTWFLIAPSEVLDLLFGDDRYPSAPTTLRLLALTAMTWAFRGVAEFTLLGDERAGTFLKVTSGGTAVMLFVGVPVVLKYGAIGATIAVLVSEVLMTVWLLVVEPALSGRPMARAAAPAGAVAVATACALFPLSSSIGLALVVVSVATVVAMLLALRSIRGIESAVPA